MQHVSPFVKTGMILDLFSNLGKTQVSNARLKSIAIRNDSTLVQSVIRNAGVLSGPRVWFG